ncbi:MAG TPA: DNA repair protein RadC [Phnomibacter sp.]|nr:DNA repair protein RadC [Phnomibacter sp.]
MENFHKAHTPIKQWADDDRPREKMMKHGADTLSSAELLAILMNNGTKNKSAIDLARELLQLADNRISRLAKMSLNDLQKIKGIGPAKALSIKAALQMGILLEKEGFDDKDVMRSSKDIAQYLRKKLQHEPREIFVAVFLNRSNKVLGVETISTGGITGTVVDPRIILRRAIEVQACSIVLSHNHPSGSLRPSEADKRLTAKIKAAASLVDMEVLDHLIVSDQGYYSFADSGEL